MTAAEIPTTPEGYKRRDCQRTIFKAANDLRRIADDIDRIAEELDRSGLGGYSSYGSLASRVYHTVAWGLANTNLDRLAEDAAEADVYRAEVTS